jgi:hypothetical protein
MATEKVRSFRYHPPRKRQKQLEEERQAERRGTHLPRAGDEEVHGRNKLLRMFLMMAAVIGLAFVMAYLNF